jgi:sialate O-acetylesterase
MKGLWLRGWLVFCFAVLQSIAINTLLKAQATSNEDFLSVNKIFTDHMVLQRDQPIHIWGKGLPGARVRVTLSRSASAVARVNRDSTWNVYLPAQAASSDPRDLKIISGNKNILISNVLLGDIWICIGQSNMEWPMQREMYYREAMATANQPLLRFYNPSYAGKNIFNQYFSDSVLQIMHPSKFFAPTNWQVSDSNSFRTMSAVAYYYGKSIVEKTQVPIGLINLSIAGASLETFMGIDALKSDERFAPKAIEPWLTNPAIPVWVKERGNQNLRTGTDHPFKPGHGYEAGIKPLFPLPIKGIINYQGESNAQELERVWEYAELSKCLINDYRKQWRSPTMPFYYVQLSSIDTLKYKGHFWPEFRNEQRTMLELIPFSGMAVCTDYGLKDNVHPTNKKVVGERLARWALNNNYGVKILPSGPMPIKAIYQNGELIVSFEYAGNGLQATGDGILKGFSLDGKNSATATIVQNSVHIPTKIKPEFVYYGWKSYSDGNLVNSELLPASTFKLNVQ